jgi:hypothetical protein
VERNGGDELWNHSPLIPWRRRNERGGFSLAVGCRRRDRVRYEDSSASGGTSRKRGRFSDTRSNSRIQNCQHPIWVARSLWIGHSDFTRPGLEARISVQASEAQTLPRKLASILRDKRGWTCTNKEASKPLRNSCQMSITIQCSRTITMTEGSLLQKI